MNGAQQVDATRHIYRYKMWPRGMALLVALLIAVGGFAAAYAGSSNRAQMLAPILIFTVFLLAIGAFMLAQGFGSRLTIEGNRIEVRGAFRERSADLSEIEGYRTVRSCYGSFQQLILKDGRGSISIPSGFNTDDAFRAWFARIPDLDQRDRETLLAEIEKQQDLGATPEERLGALARARQQSIVLLVAAAAAAILLNLGPNAWLELWAAVLILAPLAAAYLCWRSPLLYAVFKKKSDPRAESSFLLMVAGFGLLIRMRELHFLSVQPLAAMMILAGLAIAAAYCQPARRGSNQGAIIAILFLAGLYAYGSVAVADTAFDHTRATRYATEVLGVHVSNGRSTTYYLRVAPWGPVERESNVSVPSRVYFGTRVGDRVCFDLHSGRLKAPWYHVVPCEGPGF